MSNSYAFCKRGCKGIRCRHKQDLTQRYHGLLRILQFMKINLKIFGGINKLPYFCS